MQNHSTELCSTATQGTLDVYFAQCTTQLEMYSSHNSKLPLEKKSLTTVEKLFPAADNL